MLNFKTKNGCVVFVFLYLTIDIFYIASKSFTKFHHKLVRPVVHNMNATKYNHTFDIERPMTILVIALVVNTKRDLIAVCYRIELMTDFSAMEVYLIVFLIEIIVYWKCIRIPIIAVDGKYTSQFLI